jgi:ketosteroid isomerase-like protein
VSAASDEHNVRAALARYASAVGARDADLAVACFTSDACIRVEGAPHVPVVGRFEGPDEIRRFFETFFSLTQVDPQFVPESTEVIEHDDHLIIFSEFRHQVKDTGRYYSGDFALHCVIRGGLIARYQIYENSWSVGQAFDHPPHNA